MMAYVGSRVPRVEDARLLTGLGTYVDDIALPGMLHACFVRSPYARARVVSIDTTEAVARPGVYAVFVAGDLNDGVHEQWRTMLGPDGPRTPSPPLAEDEVRFAGDPVALILAENRYVAEDACDLVLVDYEPSPPVVDFRTAESSSELVHTRHGGNVIGELTGGTEALTEVFDDAAHTVSNTIYQQAQSAVPMEPRGIVVRHVLGEVTIWASTQSPHEVRVFSARLLGIAEHRVRVIAKDTGGGFGQKMHLQREEMCLLLAAMLVPAPVKWIEDRRENLMAAGQARTGQADVRMAFDERGLIQAARIDYIEDDGAYPTLWPVGPSATVGSLFPGPYRVPRADYTTKCVYTNTPGRVAYRAPWVFESLAREVLIDKAAREMGLDPVELRRRNLLSGTDMPYTNPNGVEYDTITPLENFEQALARFGYEAFRREQVAFRARGRYLGVGISCFVEGTAPGMGVFATEGATIRIEPAGTVTVYLAGGSAGNSLETTTIQLAADALGVAMDDVATLQGDTAATGYGTGTGGSRSGSMIAGAVLETAATLRHRIAAIAAHLLEADPQDIELTQGRATVRGSAAAGISLAELARIAYYDTGALPPGTPAGLEVTGRYRTEASFRWVNGTHICTCEVDIVTGAVKLLRYIVSDNCGTMINPIVVEGQLAGGTVQGIGGALFEQLAYDEHGNPVTTTFMDYLVPTSAEVPMIEYAHAQHSAAGSDYYKGVGESGVLGAVPAVVAAVADALTPFGVTVDRLPMTPSAIVDLLAGESA